ncbi:hypothetical protein BG842_22270 [Haladaptatus sp. W1]|uniref:hypothetical protein n=1 Tax=Haladaptatus sp. W1 TaxID=1897478 RepID=UPI000849D665|nr:hypothetical protein [Haladaptatus sp. W1]ODR83474.1 hypothetical protein BG842_22270 [Haladaptatus sp. W1]
MTVIFESPDTPRKTPPSVRDPAQIQSRRVRDQRSSRWGYVSSINTHWPELGRPSNPNVTVLIGLLSPVRLLFILSWIITRLVTPLGAWYRNIVLPFSRVNAFGPK